MRGPSVYSRLASLERQRSPETGSCPQCGGPRPGQNTFLLVTDTGEPRWGACRTCGLALRDNGTAMSAVPVTRGGRFYNPVMFRPDRWWMYDAV